MTICTSCKELASWYLLGLEEFQKATAYSHHRRDPLIQYHHLTWDPLKDSATSGCSFCAFTVDTFLGAETETGQNVDEDDRLYSGKEHEILVNRIFAHSNTLKITKSSVHGGRYVSRIVEVYIQEDDDPAGLLFGLPVQQPFAESQRSLELAKACFTECLMSHAGCWSSASTVVPPRLIDVGPSDGSVEPRLVDTAEEKPDCTVSKVQPFRYATLSHRWGDCHHFTTTTSSIANFKSAIPWAALPHTFRDAITVVRFLQLRYIWIDSLCIVQDSVSDWEQQSAQMGSFYQNGVVNIVSNAKDTSQGFLFLEQYHGFLPYDINHPSNGQLSGTLLLTSDSALQKDADRRGIPAHAPALNRGWVVQEQLLSQRAITYGPLSCTWSCQELRKRQGQDAERRWWENDLKKYGAQLLNYEEKQVARFSAAQRFFFTLATDMPTSTDIARALDQWRGIVEYYASKELTFHTDKLPAISGLAKILAGVIGGEYLAGVWEADMPLGLLWGPARKDSFYADPVEKLDTYIAPSWSWASRPGPIQYYYAEAMEEVKSVTQFKGSCTKLNGKNSFGEVSSCAIKLYGVLHRSHIIQDIGPQSSFKTADFGGARQHSMLTLDYHSMDIQLGTKVGILALAHGKFTESAAEGLDSSTRDKPWTICLVLRLVENATDTYERIGRYMCIYDKDDILISGVREIITFV